jgi:hypothetical protein
MNIQVPIYEDRREKLFKSEHCTIPQFIFTPLQDLLICFVHILVIFDCIGTYLQNPIYRTCRSKLSLAVQHFSSPYIPVLCSMQ